MLPYRNKATIIVAVMGFLIILGGHQVYSQQTRLGIKAALNVAWFGGSDWNDFVRNLGSLPGIDPNNEFNVGFIGGAFVEFGVTQGRQERWRNHRNPEMGSYTI